MLNRIGDKIPSCLTPSVVIIGSDIVVQIPTMQGSAICYHEHFVVVSKANNGVKTTPAAQYGNDDVT